MRNFLIFISICSILSSILEVIFIRSVCQSIISFWLIFLVFSLWGFLLFWRCLLRKMLYCRNRRIRNNSVLWNFRMNWCLRKSFKFLKLLSMLRLKILMIKFHQKYPAFQISPTKSPWLSAKHFQYPSYHAG